MDLFGALLLFGVSVFAVYAADESRIEVIPKGAELSKPKGESFGLTCKATVSNMDLLTNFRWLDPKNQTIDENYTRLNNRFSVQKEVPGQMLLLINKISENDVGAYTCVGEYNQKPLAEVKQLKIFRPIKWLDANPEQSAKLGSSYKITCKVEADPSPTVTWKKNGVRVTTSDQRVTSDVDGLTINGVQESDDGTYICEVVVAETGEYKTATINFEVVSTPKVLSMEASPSDVVEGENVRIMCNTSGKPKPTITWISRKDGSVSQPGADGILYLNKVSKKDGGQYKCVAANKAGQDEKNITLNIVSKPEIIESTNATISVGNNGKLECYVEGYPTPQVSIRKQGQHHQTGETNDLASPVVIKDDPKKRPNTVLATLNLDRVQRAMDGLYECVASNKVGEKVVEAIRNLHVTVQYKPTFEKTGYIKEQVTWGQRPVNLTCIAESLPNASITWYNGPNINTNPITPTNMYKIYGTGPRSDLQITPLNKDVYGIYTCKAANILGEAFHRITLKEAFAPDTIRSVEPVDVTASSITFRFDNPGSNGVLPIKGYNVQYLKEESGSDWNKNEPLTWPLGGPYVIKDLTPLAKYTFRFRAFNDAGTGQWGGFVTKQMPAISSPSEPVITNPLAANEKFIKSPQANEIHLQWTIPSSNGADIDKYIVKYCPAQVDQNLPEGFFVALESCPSQEIPYNEYASAYTIDKLNSNTYYRVELTAHNNIGYSQSSQRFFLTNDNNVANDNMPNTGLKSSILIYLVVAILIAILVIVDIFCFFFNKTGVFYLVCGACCGKKKKNDDKLGSESKDLISNGHHKKIDIEEQSPMITDGTKKDTAVEYDLKKGTLKTGFVGKDSAV